MCFKRYVAMKATQSHKNTVNGDVIWKSVDYASQIRPSLI